MISKIKFVESTKSEVSNVESTSEHFARLNRKFSEFFISNSCYPITDVALLNRTHETYLYNRALKRIVFEFETQN